MSGGCCQSGTNHANVVVECFRSPFQQAKALQINVWFAMHHSAWNKCDACICKHACAHQLSHLHFMAACQSASFGSACRRRSVVFSQCTRCCRALAASCSHSACLRTRCAAPSALPGASQVQPAARCGAVGLPSSWPGAWCTMVIAVLSRLVIALAMFGSSVSRHAATHEVQKASCICHNSSKSQGWLALAVPKELQASQASVARWCTSQHVTACTAACMHA